jgi:transcription antitermination factor NusA-like protein
MDEIIKL